MTFDLASQLAEGPFARFVASPQESAGHLAFHFFGWATEGDAVDDCGGSYALYTRVFHYAVSLYEHGFTHLFGGPDKVTGLTPRTDVADPDTMWVVSEDQWNILVYRRARGLPPVPTTIPKYE